MSVDNQVGLPEEVFEIILQHLDLEDVLSCSLVCLGWRNAVNSDRIWEKLCRKNISEDRLKLRTERKRVGSSYEVFESDNMPKLCVFRRRYMDDVDLKRNWKNGRCQEESIMHFDGSISYYRMFETDNELLLMPKGGDNSSYTVFNIRDKPIMTGEIHLALKDHKTEPIKLSNNILVIVQQMLLQVYVKDYDKNLKLKFCALFDRDHSETIPDNQDLSNWYEQIGYPSNLNIMFDHNGKYFVGLYKRNAANSRYSPLHVWDLESQTKIQEVVFPMQMPGERLFGVSLFLRDNIHIILTYRSCISIYAYDIEKSSYSETVLQLEGRRLSCLLFTGTITIMENLAEEKLLLFDLRDGRVLDALTTKERIDADTVQAFGNIVTYAEGGYDGDPSIVTVYNTEKLCLVDKFKFEFKYGLISSCHIVMEDLLIVGTYENQLLIRDMKTREILRTVECFSFLPPDPSCSKLVLHKPGNELVVLHFW